MQGTVLDAHRRKDHTQNKWRRTEINEESTFMVWPTLGSSTAKEQKKELENAWHSLAYSPLGAIVSPLSLLSFISRVQLCRTSISNRVSISTFARWQHGYFSLIPARGRHCGTARLCHAFLVLLCFRNILGYKHSNSGQHPTHRYFITIMYTLSVNWIVFQLGYDS